MGICVDSSTKYLKKLGYNVVRLPREGISPLQLIGVQNDQTLALGTLRQLVASSAQPLPEIQKDEKVTGIEGQRSSDLSAAIGLNVLGGIIGAMGGNLGVDVSYKSAKTITFQYASVLGDSISPLDAGNYLRDAEVDAKNKILEQYVLGKGRLYLIVRTIKSTKFHVEAKDSSGGGVRLDVPLVQQIVGGNVEVKAESNESTAVTYEGKVPLVFGFQCLDVGVRDGVLSLENTPAGSNAMGAGGATTATGAGAQHVLVQLEPLGLVELAGPGV